MVVNFIVVKDKYCFLVNLYLVGGIYINDDFFILERFFYFLF